MATTPSSDRPLQSIPNMEFQAVPRKPKATTNLLFHQMPRGRQVWESVGGALLTGAVCGFLLTLTWWAYLIGVLVSFAGGLPGGGQHRTLRGALARGFIGGTVWAFAVYTVAGMTGAVPAVALPGSMLAFLPWGFVPSCVVATIVWLSTRKKRRTPAAEALA